MSDNPTNSLNLTPNQLDKAISMVFHGVSSFTLTVGADSGSDGRNVMFSGQGVLACCDLFL